jgi:hypothetical protein
MPELFGTSTNTSDIRLGVLADTGALLNIDDAARELDAGCG